MKKPRSLRGLDTHGGRARLRTRYEKVSPYECTQTGTRFNFRYMSVHAAPCTARADADNCGMFSIRFVADCPATDDFFALFETTGWNAKYQATPHDLISAIENSWYVLCAYVEDRLVGFGRILCDGSMHALILDLIVDPTCQGQGIGSEMLSRLVAVCRGAGIRDIQLFSAQGKASFYEQQGFAARPKDAPGMEFLSE